MLGSQFRYLNEGQTGVLRDRVFDLLAEHGVKLDPYPELFDTLQAAGAELDRQNGMLRFPRRVMEDLLAQAPGSFTLGARNPEKSLVLPRADGSFYGRSAGGCHGWIDPGTGAYEQVSKEKFATWVRLINQLDEIHLLSMLFCNDAPVNTADIHALSVLLKNTDKSVWVQPYSRDSLDYLLQLAEVAAGGRQALADNPVISMIVCSLTPRTFKMMDLEAIMKCVKAGVPLQACSVPGAGGTSPATVPGTVLLAVAEILAMAAMAQAIQPGAKVVACPLIFSTDMRTGRSLQSSVESIRAASMAVQVLKEVFGLPTHNYGSGADSPIPDEQSVAERVMVSTWMAASGLDILGGAGQLEAVTAASPLQLILDNEILAMTRNIVAPAALDDDQLAFDVLAETRPGDHFLTSMHTLNHCRETFVPEHFIRMNREAWSKDRSTLMERIHDSYKQLLQQDNAMAAPAEPAQEIDAVVQAADSRLAD